MLRLITNYSTIKEYLMTVSEKIVADFVANNVEFITTVPCKQLAAGRFLSHQLLPPICIIQYVQVS